MMRPLESVRTYSFDVFDTCITRMHAHPQDLFFDIGIELFPHQKNDETNASIFAEKFQKIRISSEKQANRLNTIKNGNANIFDIYTILKSKIDTPKTINDLVNIELRHEEKSIYAVAHTVREINALRAAGNKILFISDMYIPEKFLRTILEKNNIIKVNEHLYVSCDHGASKHSGELYKRVLMYEGINASEILHTGDNFYSDILMAKKFGISTNYFSSACLNQYELRTTESKLPRTPFNTWSVSLARRLRLANENEVVFPEEYKPLLGPIYTKVAPLLVAYVSWLLKDAKQKGIQRLYFLARDGEILYRIAKSLDSYDIQLEYLYGSRISWSGASANPRSEAWRNALVKSGQRNSKADIVGRIGLSEDDQNTIREILRIPLTQWHCPMEKNEAYTFSTCTLDNSDIFTVIEKSASNLRGNVFSYFKQSGLLDDDISWAIVDVGWALNLQASLKYIIETETKKCYTPIGYYFSLSKDHLPASKVGIFNVFTKNTGLLFSRRAAVVEHFFLASTHASTVSYSITNKGIIPLLGNETRGESELLFAEALQQVVERASVFFASHPEYLQKLELFQSSIVQSALDFLSAPRKSEATAVAKLSSIVDSRHESKFSQPLCKKLDIRDIFIIIGMSSSKKKNFSTPAYMWLEGSAKISPFFVRYIISIFQKFKKIISSNE